jgi:hypothetical protein
MINDNPDNLYSMLFFYCNVYTLMVYRKQPNINDNLDVRIDAPWNDKIESYIRSIRNSAKENELKHEEAGFHFKKRKTWFGLPTTIVPLVMAPVTLVLGSGHPYALPISACALLVSGLSSGINDFFSYSEQTSNNFNSNANWAMLVSEIDCELTKERKFRQSADVFMARSQMKFDALTIKAPVVPKSVISIMAKKNKKLPEKAFLRSSMV